MRNFFLAFSLFISAAGAYAQYVPQNTIIPQITANKIAVFKGNGTIQVPVKAYRPTIIVNKVSGTGSVTFTGCVPQPGAQPIGGMPSISACTDDCINQMTVLCSSYELTMATCSSCNFEVYSLEER